MPPHHGVLRSSENRLLLPDEPESQLDGIRGRSSKRCSAASGVMNNLTKWPIRGKMHVPSHLEHQLTETQLQIRVEPGWRSKVF
jgi:hypothetical protein